MKDYIVIEGAREHNLKNVSLKIPRNKLVVFSGVSGSGKSSLVFDTIVAEAQRQYLESFSALSRRYMPKFGHPLVDKINNLSPVMVLDQQRLGRNSRSTVGTVTEIYTYLRLLYSRCGSPTVGDSTMFSFNTAEGACPECKGLGVEITIDPKSVVDFDKSLNEGAISETTFNPGGRYFNILKTAERVDFDKPIKEYSEEELEFLLYSPKVVLKNTDQGFVQSYSWEGVINRIIGHTNDTRGISDRTAKQEGKHWITNTCPECNGSRLKPDASKVTVNDKTIQELVNLPLTELKMFIETVNGSIEDPIVNQMLSSLSGLINIGAGYLSLNRTVPTLSGGESQRVKMAKQLGSNLVELLYVLDEPSVGLHPRDINHLVNMLYKLRDKGNSVLVVEHDPEIISSADEVIDIGPKAGTDGGKVMFQGSVNGLLETTDSLTANFLTKKHAVKSKYRDHNGVFEIKSAAVHNLKKVNVDIPKGVFVCVTGVAGSGKSSLVIDVFAKKQPDAIIVDQRQVGKSIKSIPATYVGVFDLIRKKFARENNVSPALLSFNSKGACSKCKGNGVKKIEMHFLDDVLIACNQCKGKRYNNDALELKYKGKDIADVLNLTVTEALELFDDNQIISHLEVLEQVGLDYLTLGQPLNTLSGGESQRIKLAKELNKKGNIYILDEPTSGLHMADIDKLLKLLNKLVDAGNSVIVIEHNLDVIANADWIIDLGPEGGDMGGEIVAKGTPFEISKVKVSYTGQYLKKLFTN